MPTCVDRDQSFLYQIFRLHRASANTIELPFEISPQLAAQPFEQCPMRGGIAVQPRDHQGAKIRFTRPYIH
jgi:hypothetical protein